MAVKTPPPKIPSILRLFLVVGIGVCDAFLLEKRLRRLRAASLHEAPNSPNSTTFLGAHEVSEFILKPESSIELLSGFFVDRADRADRSNRNYGNVAIKREQRLLADYAEHEQRKDCEAGLIMGV